MSNPSDDVRAVPSDVRVHGEIRAPGSKSHAIRVLIAAALAEGTTRLSGVPDNADTVAVVTALRALGVSIESDESHLTVTGCAGRLPLDSASLDLGGSGTGLRFLSVVCTLGPGPYRLDGDASLRRRPLAGVEDVIRQLGCFVRTTDGCAPLVVEGGPALGVPDSGLDVEGTQSSQPVSAALLVAAAMSGGSTIRCAGPLVSGDYVSMTSHALSEFGVSTSDRAIGAEREFRLASAGLRGGGETAIEGDWSSAAFLLGAAAVAGGEVRVRGLPEAVYADSEILHVLGAMGADVSWTHRLMQPFDEADAWGDDGFGCERGELRPVHIELTHCPDLAPLVGALGCVAEGTTEVTGAAHLRIKESDRIASTVAAARAIGCEAEERDDGFVIHGGGATGGTVDPRGDHRIAMAFAVAGLAIPGVRIRDPGCVAKSYPGFWDDLARLTAD